MLLDMLPEPDIRWLEDRVQDGVGLGSNPAEGAGNLLADDVAVERDDVHCPSN